MTPEAWRTFLKSLLSSSLLLGLAIYLFILVLDPYQNVPFSPSLERAPIDTNQRFSYPALARDDRFDSAIFGTSTLRMMDPEHLNPLLGARFANLSMNGSTAYEETEIFKLFNRHHPRSRYLIFGIDVSWCELKDEIPRFTFRLFPQWMYDEDPWNDLAYLFNDKALENAVRMLEFQLGAREAKYQTNGYRDFLPGHGQYDLVKVRSDIYGSANYQLPADYRVPDLSPTNGRPFWRFGTHALMSEILAAAPAAAQKVLLFVPYHHHMLSKIAPTYAECKGRLVEIAAPYPNTHLIDFMIPSTITMDDGNYWDVLHHTREMADELERLTARALTERRDLDGYYRYLRASSTQP